MSFENDEVLLKNIKAHMAFLIALEESDEYLDDALYRFYHFSFEVYALQAKTKQIVDFLRKLAPKPGPLNTFFETIISEGASDKRWELSHNQNWMKHARPIVEAFFHSYQFLQFAIKSGNELDSAPQVLPASWAALLELYNIR